MEHIKKYNDYLNINEYLNPPMTEQELLEMSNYWQDDTGLDNTIVLYMGSTVNTPHVPRIKVSNIPGKSMGNSRDSFTITVPKLIIIGNINKKHINNKKLKTIFEFIMINEQAIIDISNEIISTGEFVKSLKKYQG